MRTTTLTALAVCTLAAIGLSGCTASSPAPSATPSASATTAGGVPDPTGACTDGQSTPAVDGREYSVTSCDLVDVVASKATVEVGSTKQLSVEGHDNTITVHETPKVTTVGHGNVVYYTGDEPVLEELGSDNVLRPATDD
ncbi:DUF3060 domain-containing protein [Curtobacterium sp. UCD-KPL2560]|uniref:DUF3060 domain-containing protein n=1 Tax=Curtobacterium sp. UCD-KPL2560 TaxID=1885315 RepID=UPI000826685A|nr:DUF3060 domain-containing protein [Curtobacterium sp. UCD-KPL2560]